MGFTLVLRLGRGLLENQTLGHSACSRLSIQVIGKSPTTRNDIGHSFGPKVRSERPFKEYATSALALL